MTAIFKSFRLEAQSELWHRFDAEKRSENDLPLARSSQTLFGLILTELPREQRLAQLTIKSAFIWAWTSRYGPEISRRKSAPIRIANRESRKLPCRSVKMSRVPVVSVATDTQARRPCHDRLKTVWGSV